MKYQASIRTDEYAMRTCWLMRRISDNGDIEEAIEVKWSPGVRHQIPTELDNGHDTKDMLQAIVDAAWEAGIKPSQATSQATRTDIESHLNDMRTLAFHALKVGDKGK